jgi:hypothetical protein
MTDQRSAEQTGAQRPGMVPYGDVETAMKREAEIIAQRFPDTDPAVVDATVREVVAELRAEAEIEVHVLALARHRVYDRLRERGHAFLPPIADSDDDSDDGRPAP